MRKLTEFSTTQSSGKSFGVVSEFVHRIWVEVEPFIESALEYSDGKYSASDIRTALICREMQLWVYAGEKIEAVAVTQLQVFPKKRVCFFVIVAGRHARNWLSEEKLILNWAKAHGCNSIEAFARPGWTKLVKDYQPIHVVLRKKI